MLYMLRGNGSAFKTLHPPAFMRPSLQLSGPILIAGVHGNEPVEAAGSLGPMAALLVQAAQQTQGSNLTFIPFQDLVQCNTRLN